MSTERPNATGTVADIERQDDLAARALAYYKDTLKSRLEPEHDGEGIAIHPDSGEYLPSEP